MGARTLLTLTAAAPAGAQGAIKVKQMLEMARALLLRLYLGR